MCHFHYKKFDSCGDYGIEVSHVCDEALWRAGLRGVLQICVPRILERSLEWSGRDDQEPPKPALFRGYDGFCEICVTKFKLPCSILQRTYSDHELDYSRPWNSFNADDLGPYISFAGLTAQIPELLGLADQFEAARLKQGPHMIFYKSLAQGTWSQLRSTLPFTYKGAFQSDCSLGFDETMKRLNINAGITEHDRDQVVYAIQHGPHPRVVYNTLFRPRGMPLGHFSISIVNSCQQIVSTIRAQKATVVKKALQQHIEYSDDSSLTTLTSTPVLSDAELPAPKSPSRDSEISDTPKYDGSTSTPRKSRKLQAWQSPRTGNQTTAIKLALSAASPSRNMKAPLDLSAKPAASITYGLATGNAPYQLKHHEIEGAPTHGSAVQDGRRGSKMTAQVVAKEQQSTAERVKRPRRMAIAQQGFDEFRLGPLTQGFESSNALKSVLDNHGQGAGFEQDSENQQPLKDPTQESGNGTPVPTPYYKAAGAFKWKILERPGYGRTPKASHAAESQERKVLGGQDCPRPPMTGADQSQTAIKPPAPQRPYRDQGQAAQSQEAVLIPDDSDGDVKMDDADQSTGQPETRLDSSTLRRLQDSGLLDRSRRR